LLTGLVDLNPEWDQIIYTPVHSLKETLLLEVMDYQNLTKDRSLGTVELKVGELARETKDVGRPRFAFESTGKAETAEPIRLDQGNQYKGQLHYVAEFLPAFALQGLKFDAGPNELRSAGKDTDDSGSDNAASSSSSSTSSKVTRAITATQPVGVPNGHTKNQQSEDSTFTAVSADTAEAKTVVGSGGEGQPPNKKKESVDEGEEARSEKEGIKMSKDELLTHRG
jgi:hypothetical protein